MNEEQTPSDVLTSDLHGGRGFKLTDGFHGNTNGRPKYVPPPAAINKRGRTPDDKKVSQLIAPPRRRLGG